MKIREITSYNRRDFYAIYECEHCGHLVIIPAMKWPNCGKAADPTYRPLTTRYPDSQEL